MATVEKNAPEMLQLAEAEEQLKRSQDALYLADTDAPAPAPAPAPPAPDNKLHIVVEGQTVTIVTHPGAAILNSSDETESLEEEPDPTESEPNSESLDEDETEDLTESPNTEAFDGDDTE